MKVNSRSPDQDATLQVKVRELPTESTAMETTAHVTKQAAEKYKQEFLEELKRMETDIAHFSVVLMDRDVSHISAFSFTVEHFSLKRFAVWSM